MISMLENEILELRPISVEDTDNILKWRNSKEVKKFFCMQEDLTREGHLSWLENKVKTGKVVQYIIHVKDSDKDLGSVYIRNIDKEHSNGEFGIFIGEVCDRGHGYGTMAMKLICDYAFKKLHLHKIYLRVLEDNKGAIASYKKNQFEEEGIFKDHVYNPEVGYLNLVFMGRINPYE